MNHTHIFICGLNRSGTSMLHRTLSAHPAIGGFSGTGAPEDEGQHLQSVFPPAKKYGGAGKFAFAPEAHLTETSPLVTLENRSKLWSEWSRHWNIQKPFLIEKSPPNLIRSRFLQALFPGSIFIFLLRHPLAVSYATQKWAKSGIRELVEHWVVAHQIMAEDIPHIKHHLLLRYEDLVQQPQATLTRVCNYLRIEDTLQPAVERGINEKYLAQWEADIAQHPMLMRRMRLLHALPNRFGYSFRPPYVEPLDAALPALQAS